MESAQGQRLDTHRSGLCLRGLQGQDNTTRQGDSMSEALQTMVFSRMASLPANVNPIAPHIDSSSMSQNFGEHIVLVFTNWASDCFTIYHKRTGERIKVHLTELGEFQCHNKDTKVTVPMLRGDEE